MLASHFWSYCWLAALDWCVWRRCNCAFQSKGWQPNRWLLRQRQLLLRANQLVAADVERGVALAPELLSSCNLAGRQLWLQLLGADGSVTTYSLGAPPSAIWRAQVLMRCGPAYGLDGQIKAGSTPQNRVVLDGLSGASQPWMGCQLPQALVMQDVAVCWEPASGSVQWLLQIERDGVISDLQGHALLKDW